MSLTERDRAIVSLTGEREALTREQIARAVSFGSVTRTNSVLLRLTRAGYLARRFQPTLAGTRRAVYVLGPAGHELLNGTPVRSRFRTSSDLFLEHQLAVNDVWLSFVRLRAKDYSLTRWLSSAELRAASLGCVPDAYIEYAIDGRSFAAFIEVDLGSETLKRWDGKVRPYLNLAFSGRYSEVFRRQYFRVLVVAHSAKRAGTIRQAISKHTEQIFWLADRRALNESGPLAEIWQRPKDAAFQSLTNP